MALRESGEDYLESIYVLSERQGIVREDVFKTKPGPGRRDHKQATGS